MNNLARVPQILKAEAELRRSTVWRAYHIFYGGNPLTVLSDCIIPLAERLKVEGLIIEYFYINYWVEGSHVRLRLRANGCSQRLIEDIDVAVCEEVGSYLRSFPSYHPMAELANHNFYETLFVGEFTDADRPRYFHTDGSPIFARNNSIEIRPYEPEWGRYGGEIGMLIAERYFVDSTQFAVSLMKLGNLNTRTILLGLSAQISYITALCLLKKKDLIENFFRAYYHRWAKGYDTQRNYDSEEGRRRYRQTVEKLQVQTGLYSHAIAAGLIDGVPEFLRPWVRQCEHTRQRIAAACAEQALFFSYDDGERLVTDLDDAAWSFCHSFIHMMNNRITVSVADEAFLAYELYLALHEGDDIYE